MSELHTLLSLLHALLPHVPHAAVGIPFFVGKTTPDSPTVTDTTTMDDSVVTLQIVNCISELEIVAVADNFPVSIHNSSLNSDANLVNYYRLNGNGTDEKGAANGTVVGSPSFSTSFSPFNDGSQGVFLNNTLNVNSATQYISAAFLAPGSGDFTYLAWVNIRAVDTVGGNLSAVIHNEANGGSGRPSTRLSVNPTPITATVADNDATSGSSALTQGPLDTGAWHLLTATRTGGVLSLYIDGVLVASGKDSLTSISTSNGQLGRRLNTSYPAQFPLNAYMADAAMFNRALTVAEIQSLFGVGYSPTISISGGTPSPSVTDSIAVSDTPTILIPTLVPSVTDSTAVSDTPTIEIVSFLSVADSTAVSDIPGYNDDTAYMVELVAISVTFGTPTINVSDTSAVSDTPTIELISFISPTDSTAVSDIPTVIAYLIVKTETDVVSDDLGDSIAFNGTSTDVVTIGNSYVIPSTGFSIEFWYNSTTWTLNARVLDDQDAGPANGVTFLQGPSTGNLEAAIRNGASQTAGLITAALNDGQWYHVVLTSDGTIATLYVNGSQVAQDTSATMTNAAAAVKLGRRSTSSSNFFTGQLAAFRIYERALSGTEVTQHSQGVFIDETALKVWYKFLVSAGSTPDLSGNSNAGTVAGTTQTGFTVNPYVVMEEIFFASVTDSSAMSDTPTIETVFLPSVTDSTAVTDVPTLEVFSFINVIDSTAVSDTPNVQIVTGALSFTVSDSTAVSDTPIVEIIDFVNVIDSTAVSDTPTVFIPILTLAFTDSTAVTDTPTIEEIYLPTVTDSTAVADTPTIEEILLPSVNDWGTAIENDQNNALFDGTSGYITIPSISDYSIEGAASLGISFAFWVRPDTLEFINEEGSGGDRYAVIINKQMLNANEWEVRMYGQDNTVGRGNRTSFYIFAAAGGIGDGVAFQDALNAGEWIHVAATAQDVGGGVIGIRIYKNGVRRDSFSSSIVPTATAANVHVGAGFSNSSSPTSYFKGGLYQLLFWNRRLTDAEVTSVFNGSPPATGLIGEFNMSDISGSNVPDTSGTGNNGTITGGVIKAGPEQILEILSFPAPTDSTTVSDVPTLEVFSFINKTDSSVVSDTPTIEIIEEGIAVTDSTAVSDTPTIEVVSLVSVTDSSAVSDTPTTGAVDLIGVVDSTAVSDTPALEVFSFVNKTDSTAVSDTPTIEIIEQGISVTDSTAVSDTPTIELVSLFSVVDSTAVTDNPQIAEADTILVTDSTAVTATPTIEVIEEGINVTDSTAVTDTETVELISFVNPMDSTAMSDTPTIFIPILTLSVTDSTAVSDTPSVSIGGGVSVTDTTPVSDSPTIFIPILTLSVSDSTAATDTPTLEVFSSVSKTDTTAVSDTPALELLFYVSASDQSAVSDTPVLEVFSVVSVNDSTTTTDTVVIEAIEEGVIVTDTTAVSDTPTVLIVNASALTINVADSTAVGDTPTLEVFSFISTSDSTAVSGTPTVEIIEEGLNVTDSTAVSDTPTLHVPVNATVQDATAVSDTPTLSLTSYIDVSDVTAVSDTPVITIFGTRQVVVTDTTAVSDVFNGGTKFDVPAFTGTIRLGWKFAAYTLVGDGVQETVVRSSQNKTFTLTL